MDKGTGAGGQGDKMWDKIRRSFPPDTVAIIFVFIDEFPTVTERKAIQHLSSGKAPGTDAIPAEVYKAGGLPMAEKTDIDVSMHVEKGGYPTRLQGCFHNPPIQTERKASSL